MPRRKKLKAKANGKATREVRPSATRLIFAFFDWKGLFPQNNARHQGSPRRNCARTSRVAMRPWTKNKDLGNVGKVKTKGAAGAGAYLARKHVKRFLHWAERQRRLLRRCRDARRGLADAKALADRVAREPPKVAPKRRGRRELCRRRIRRRPRFFGVMSASSRATARQLKSERGEPWLLALRSKSRWASPSVMQRINFSGRSLADLLPNSSLYIDVTSRQAGTRYVPPPTLSAFHAVAMLSAFQSPASVALPFANVIVRSSPPSASCFASESYSPKIPTNKRMASCTTSLRVVTILLLLLPLLLPAQRRDMRERIVRIEYRAVGANRNPGPIADTDRDRREPRGARGCPRPYQEQEGSRVLAAAAFLGRRDCPQHTNVVLQFSVDHNAYVDVGHRRR